MLTIYKPGVVPVRGLRTSLKGAQLSDGYFQAIDNLRWDTGALTVRDGITTVGHLNGATACLGAWSGALNGTYYVVSAWLVGSQVAVYTLDLDSGAFTEITALAANTVPSWGGTQATIAGIGGGGTAGGTRLTSTRPDGSSAEATFCVHTVARRVIAGTIVPPVDVLSINNLEDYPLIWNPTQISHLQTIQQKNIVVPVGGTQFNSFAQFSSFLPVATLVTGGGGNSKAYSSSAATHYKFSDTSVAPYNSGSNYCLLLNVNSTVVNGDNTKVTFAGSAVDFSGEQINFMLEGLAPNIQDAFTNVKIEVSPDDVHYFTVYDSASTDPVLSFPPISTAFDTGANRSMMTYSLKNIPIANRAIKYLRFTRNGTSASTYTVAILAIAGAGPGAGFYGNTEFQLAYVDTFSFAESGKIIATDVGSDLLKNAGGPSVVTSGSASVPGTKIPVSPDVLYDFSLHVKNSDADTAYYGGLNGLPSALDLYFRTAEEAAADDDALYWTTLNLYVPVTLTSGKGWSMASEWQPGGVASSVISISTAIYGWGARFNISDRDVRDPGFPAPSAYNVAMPRSLAVWTANQRSFAGAIKDTSDNYCYGDLYFSALGFPFRFASTEDSATAASRLTFAGEKIRAGVMTAAAADGASIIYVLTDQSFNSLGTAGGLVGGGYDATSLSTRVRINAHGTNEPFSIAERAGVIFYIDQEGQIMRFAGGGPQSISRNTVDDKTKNIPAARRGHSCGVFWKDRYYLAYTPASGSENSAILGWNDVIGDWEFRDTLPSPIVAERIVRSFDASQIGGGCRLLAFSDDGHVYGYEEGSTEPGSSGGPLVELRTREYQTPDLNLFRFGSCQLMVDAQSATLNADFTYKPRESVFRGTVDCSDSESKPMAIKRDTRIRTEITSTGAPENGWSGAVDFNGNLAAGTVLWRIEADMEPLSLGAGER